MKIELILFEMLVLSMIVIASVVGTSFDEFKVSFKKAYSSTESKRRKAIFERNVNKIAEMNRNSNDQGDTVRFAVYEFADLDDQEFKRTHLGLPAPSSKSILRSAKAAKVIPDSANDTFSNYRSLFLTKLDYSIEF